MAEEGARKRWAEKDGRRTRRGGRRADVCTEIWAEVSRVGCGPSAPGHAFVHPALSDGQVAPAFQKGHIPEGEQLAER